MCQTLNMEEVHPIEKTGTCGDLVPSVSTSIEEIPGRTGLIGSQIIFGAQESAAQELAIEMHVIC